MTGLPKSILVQLLIYLVTAIAICYHIITSAIANKVLRTSLIQIFIKNLLVCSNYFLSLALSITGTRCNKIHSNSSHYIYLIVRNTLEFLLFCLFLFWLFVYMRSQKWHTTIWLYIRGKICNCRFFLYSLFISLSPSLYRKSWKIRTHWHVFKPSP